MFILIKAHQMYFYKNNNLSNIYSEEKVLSVFMFSHNINSTGYIILNFYAIVVLS